MSTTNGHAPNLAEIREQLQLARTQLKLRQTQAQLGLLEAVDNYGYGRYIDPAERWRDMADDYPFATHLGTTDRRDGNNGPFITTEAELTAARNVARFLAQRHPTAIGLVETVVDFVVGEGMLPTVGSKERAATQLVTDAQDVLDDFVEVNEYDEFQQELVGRAVVDGEYFECYFPQGDQLLVRAWEPEYVRKPVGLNLSSDWDWGIHSPEGDICTALEYAMGAGTLESEQVVPAQYVNHVKRNVVRNVKRGLADFYSTEDALENVRKLLKCAGIGESIRASIVGFWKYDSAPSSAVNRHIANTRDNIQPGQHPVTGKDANHQRHQPGTIIHAPKGKEFQPPPSSPNAQAQTGIIQAILRHVFNRWGMPEYFSGDSSNANFASTLVSGAPFVRRVKRNQKFFKRRFQRTFWKALQVAWEAGRLGRGRSWEEMQFLLDVQLEPQEPTIANELEQAGVNEILHRNGILSKQTWRQKQGLDDEQERKNLAEEPATPPAPPQAGSGGAGQPPFLKAFAG